MRYGWDFPACLAAQDVNSVISGPYFTAEEAF